jgi:hypothetical protein
MDLFKVHITISLLMDLKQNNISLAKKPLIVMDRFFKLVEKTINR